jgi:hypothetical protein
MEILRSDIALRDGDIELHLDGQHQIHHFQGADPQVAELSFQREWLWNSAPCPQYRRYKRD